MVVGAKHFLPQNHWQYRGEKYFARTILFSMNPMPYLRLRTCAACPYMMPDLLIFHTNRRDTLRVSVVVTAWDF